MNTIVSSTPAFSTSELLKNVSAIGPLLQRHAAEERVNRRLSQPIINALKDAGLFRLYLPQSLGGLEVDPMTAARVTEEVAHYNTAAGWALMVANTSAWWCNKLSEEGTAQIYATGSDVFIAGAFHPPLKATQANGGYIINGRSPLASNVHEANRIFATALVMENGQPVMNNGMPNIIGVFMDANDCQILDTWHTIGMNATDSNDFCANDVFVATSLTFPVIPASSSNSHYAGPLYRFPAIGAGVASLIIPVALAVARNAVEEIKTLAAKKVPFGSATAMKDRGTVQRKLGIAEALIQAGRAWLYQEMTTCWKKTLSGEIISMEDRARLLLAVTHANQSCAQAVEHVYSAAGTSAIYKTSPLANYFTDAQVIRQHGFSNESRYETAAQIFLGLPPDLPVVMF
jgi:alkylation response protein AidB-like acyl-CoA dehydrogenase